MKEIVNFILFWQLRALLVDAEFINSMFGKNIRLKLSFYFSIKTMVDRKMFTCLDIP